MKNLSANSDQDWIYKLLSLHEVVLVLMMLKMFCCGLRDRLLF